MGVVLKAQHTRMERIVAVKKLNAEAMQSEDLVKRFYREVKASARLLHPNVVTALDAREHEGIHYLIMEFIEGESITAVIDRIGVEGMLDWREVWTVAVHIGRALAEAYERKIIHRSVTPTNILRRHKDEVCLLGDLVLAKALVEAQGGSIHVESAPGATTTFWFDLPVAAVTTSKGAER